MWLLSWQSKNGFLQKILIPTLKELERHIFQDHAYSLEFVQVYSKPTEKGLNKEKPEPLVPLSRSTDEN
jgi:hypothetical protein